jgi:hypothetical protein
MLYHCLVRRWLPLVHMYSRADNLSRRVYWANSLFPDFILQPARPNRFVLVFSSKLTTNLVRYRFDLAIDFYFI